MKENLLSQFPLFANLPAGERRTLAETLEEHQFSPGEVVLVEGSSSKFFYLVLDGEVEIVKSLGTPDERVLAVSKARSILGEMSLFTRTGAHTASARARTPLRMLRITFEQFDSLLRRHPRLEYDMLRLYSSRLEESESLTIQDLREKNRQLTVAYQELQAAQAAMIEKKKLERELEIAGQIQREILPERLPDYPGLDFGALMIPARLVGGDFYDFIPLNDHQVGIVVGDVCDKGMPAALFMALTYSSIRAEALRHDDPGATLRAVNQHLLEINRSDMYVTLLYGMLDFASCVFTYARAGHPEPLLMSSTNQPVKVAKSLGQPIGLFEAPVIDEQRLNIPPDGTLLLYSDGLSETVEATVNSPRLPELCTAILDKEKLNAQALCETLWRTVGGSEEVSLIQDDFTVVVFKNASL
ncbi:MAG TPA: SpoIIE family protein phosphatase [Anaerolineaceae bacterium]